MKRASPLAEERLVGYTPRAELVLEHPFLRVNPLVWQRRVEAFDRAFPEGSDPDTHASQQPQPGDGAAAGSSGAGGKPVGAVSALQEDTYVLPPEWGMHKDQDG